ncbi:MAG: penicillin-binding protein [Clostridiales bacterium]|nr:penicillin-binding protein [Clostridiales bacterium]
MRNIEKRAFVCLLLALFLAAGLGFFCYRYVTQGGDWASYPFNRHMYNNQGQLISGAIYDRDGDALSECTDGKRTYYPDATVRKATLHAVGDPQGNIGTGALTAFADTLSGYNLVTGGYSPTGAGRDLTLTIDAYLNVTAYNAMAGRQGAVGVYNYKTGDILCMVSTPTYDPLNPPDLSESSEGYDGVYLNRFLSSAQVPGSIFKTVTLAAALEKMPDLENRTFTCTGETEVGGDVITCPKPHGEMDIRSALAKSCNGVFGQLAAELGASTMTEYVKKAGLTDRLSVDGILTAAGSYDLSGATQNQLGWSGIGQYKDTVNPCTMMTYMGAIANGGTAAVPRLILSVETPMGGIPTAWKRTQETTTLIEPATAAKVAEMMKNDVVQTYGSDRFRGMDIGAKSGTAEVGGDKRPNAWFTGFLDDPDHPYAFIVLVENGGGGASVAGEIAATVLRACVDKF